MQFKNALVALAVIGVSASVYAQNSMPPSPAAVLLRERSALQLSNAQIRQLEALDRSYTNTARPVQERMTRTRAADRRIRAQDRELTPAEREQLRRDSTALRRDAMELRNLRRENREAAMKVLTPSQRAKAEQMTKERVDKRRRAPGKKTPSRSGSLLNSVLESLPR